MERDYGKEKEDRASKNDSTELINHRVKEETVGGHPSEGKRKRVHDDNVLTTEIEKPRKAPNTQARVIAVNGVRVSHVTARAIWSRPEHVSRLWDVRRSPKVPRQEGVGVTKNKHYRVGGKSFAAFNRLLRRP